MVPSFDLALITPDFKTENGVDWEYYDWTGVQEDADGNPIDPKGTITPFNYESIPGVEYIKDESHAFYRITAEYMGTREGTWC